LRSSGGKDSQNFSVGVVYNGTTYQISLNQDHIPGTMVNQTTLVQLTHTENGFVIHFNNTYNTLSVGNWPLEVNLDKQP